MKRKVTFKEFFTVLGLGLWQALSYVLNIFNPKHKTWFWRITGGIIAVCLVLIVIAIGKAYYDEEIAPRRYSSSYCDTHLHGDLWYHKADWSQKGYVFNKETGKRVLKGLDWIALSDDDSLAVFAKDKMRGYFNTYTGEVVIPATFMRAWVFSEGLAAVMQSDSIFFINREGQRAFDLNIPYDPWTDAYCFHDGVYEVSLNDLNGIIDKQGRWLLKPEYESLYHTSYGFWEVKKDDCWGVYTDSLKMLFPCEYKATDVDENGVYLTLQNNVRQRYDYNGQLLDDFVIEDVNPCMYSDGTYDEEEESYSKQARCYMYSTPGGHYGLMTKEGRHVTLPSYRSIQAINEDLYLCTFEGNKYPEEGILLNSKGERVE